MNAISFRQIAAAFFLLFLTTLSVGCGQSSVTAPDISAPPVEIPEDTPEDLPEDTTPEDTVAEMEGHPVKGTEANLVEYASADGRIVGAFHQEDGLNWLETNNQGTFSFMETNRDEWSVYLHDASRGMDIQLNLWTKRVIIRGFGEYIVTGAGAKTEDLSGTVQLRNPETGRLLFSTGDPITGTGDEGGWLNSPACVGADANYYNRANWKLTKLANGNYLVTNTETGRLLFDPGSVLTGPDGNEGGWLASETMLGADANYYGRAEWRLVEAGSGRYFVRNAHTNRFLFSTGDPITGTGDEGGWLSSPACVGADANYYNRAIWEITR